MIVQYAICDNEIQENRVAVAVRAFQDIKWHLETEEKRNVNADQWGRLAPAEH